MISIFLILIHAIFLPLIAYGFFMIRRNRKVYKARVKMLDKVYKRAVRKKQTGFDLRLIYDQMSYDEMMSIKNSFTPVEKMVKEWEERIKCVKDIKKP